MIRRPPRSTLFPTRRSSDLPRLSFPLPSLTLPPAEHSALPPLTGQLRVGRAVVTHEGIDRGECLDAQLLGYSRPTNARDAESGLPGRGEQAHVMMQDDDLIQVHGDEVEKVPTRRVAPHHRFHVEKWHRGIGAR